MVKWLLWLKVHVDTEMLALLFVMGIMIVAFFCSLPEVGA